MKTVLIVEDGREYLDFAQAFLGGTFRILQVQNAKAALAMLRGEHVDRLLLDLRFDRTPESELVGDAGDMAGRVFAGDRARALRHLRDQQGVLILAELRTAGYSQPAVFVHEFTARRLANLRNLYGEVRALPGFDARTMITLLTEGG